MLKRFSKDKWLATANRQMEQGIISQREIDDALNNWVDALDGVSEDDIKISGQTVQEEWLV